MSVATEPYEEANANWNLLDPGNAGYLPHSFVGLVHLVTAAAETRTAPNPSKAGLWMKLCMKTDGGDCVVTFSSAYDEAGDTTITFTDPGQFAEFTSYEVSAGVFAWRIGSYDGVSGPTTALGSATAGALSASTFTLAGTQFAATAAEINRSADVSAHVVTHGPSDAATLSLTEALHDQKTLYVTKTDGLAIMLPVPVAGMRFKIVLGATIAAASTIKSQAGTHLMIGHARMGNNSDNSTVDWQATAANTYDTIDLFGTSNSTGGIEGQVITIEAMSTTRWFVEIAGDASGTEDTPFADTVP